MRRKLVLSVVPVLVAAVLLAIPAAAWAGGGGAIVIDLEMEARLLDGNGDSFTTARVHVVMTPSKKGNVLLVLRAKGVPNDTGRAVHWNPGNTAGLRCFLNGLDTLRWRETVSANGNLVLVAHFNIR